MPSPVLQIRIPEADLKLLCAEAENRGKQPSVLAREILSECLNGPGAGTVGRLAASKSVLQKRSKAVIHNDQTAGYIEAIKSSVPYEGPKPGGGPYKEKKAKKASAPDNMSQGRVVSLSERLRQFREQSAS